MVQFGLVCLFSLLVRRRQQGQRNKLFGSLHVLNLLSFSLCGVCGACVGFCTERVAAVCEAGLMLHGHIGFILVIRLHGFGDRVFPFH